MYHLYGRHVDFHVSSPLQAEAGGRSRTFKKFTYRGVDLDKLLDMKMNELVELLPARQKRKFSRGLKRGASTLIKKIRKAKKNAAAGEKPEPVRTHLRDMVVLPEVSRVGPGYRRRRASSLLTGVGGCSTMLPPQRSLRSFQPPHSYSLTEIYRLAALCLALATLCA